MTATDRRSIPWGIAGDHRGAWSPAYHVLATENRLPSRLPGFDAAAEACILVTPRGRGTSWAEYHVRVPGGSEARGLGAGLESFVYVLEGDLRIGSEVVERAGGFAYHAPERTGFDLASEGGATFIWLLRPYAALEGTPPPSTFAGHRDDVAVLTDDALPGAYERRLLPFDRVEFDFAFNVLTFDPGVAFDQVEVHDEDHGIYFTAGEGVYLLGDERYRVGRGDFLYLAPYCPQHFVATGAEPAEYLLYKPVNRDGFEHVRG